MSRRHALSAAVVIACSLCASPAPLRAQVTVAGPTRQIIGHLGFLSATSDIAYDPHHDVYLVVAGVERLHGVFVDRFGTPLGGEFSIRPDDNAGHYAETPRVVYSADVNDGAGGFLVTWIHREAIASTRTIRARIVAYPNRLVGSEGVVWDAGDVPAGSYGAHALHVAYSQTSRQFLAVWSVSAPHPVSNGIRARPIGPDAQVKGPVVQVATNGGSNSVVWHPSLNEFAISYAAGIVGAFAARFARLTVGGNVLSDTIVARQPTPPFNVTIVGPAIALNGRTGNYVMIWALLDTVVSFADYRFFSAEIDPRGGTIATGFIGVHRMRHFGVAYHEASRTFVVMGHCYPPVWPDEVCAVHLNEHGERISETLQITDSGRFFTSGEGMPRAASGTGGGWLVVFSKDDTYVQPITTPVTGGGPAGPPLAALCQTPDPFQSIGGGVCVYGGWVPRNHPVADRVTTIVPPQPPAGCTTPDPFAVLGGGTCVNGGWLPPGHPGANTTSPIGGCTIPDPFATLGGGVCVNGGWVPRSD
jgi:hypothetical protein